MMKFLAYVAGRPARPATVRDVAILAAVALLLAALRSAPPLLTFLAGR